MYKQFEGILGQETGL